MIKIGMIGIAAVFLALLLKKEKGELALLVGIAASVLIFVKTVFTAGSMWASTPTVG